MSDITHKIRSGLIVASVLGLLRAAPPAIAQIAGQTCNQIGATAMNAARTEVLACLADKVWYRGSTSNVNLNSIPVCTQPGQVLHFDGVKFICATLDASTDTPTNCPSGQT